MHILLIEDDRGTREALAFVLRTFNHAATGARTLAEGRTLLGTQPFDLVISDYHLPDGLGTEFLEEVSRTHPRMPRLLMSAGKDPGGHTASFLAKPPDLASFRAVIEGLLKPA